MKKKTLISIGAISTILSPFIAISCNNGLPKEINDVVGLERSNGMKNLRIAILKANDYLISSKDPIEKKIEFYLKMAKARSRYIKYGLNNVAIEAEIQINNIIASKNYDQIFTAMNYLSATINNVSDKKAFTEIYSFVDYVLKNTTKQRIDKIKTTYNNINSKDAEFIVVAFNYLQSFVKQSGLNEKEKQDLLESISKYWENSDQVLKAGVEKIIADLDKKIDKKLSFILISDFRKSVDYYRKIYNKKNKPSSLEKSILDFQTKMQNKIAEKIIGIFENIKNNKAKFTLTELKQQINDLIPYLRVVDQVNQRKIQAAFIPIAEIMNEKVKIDVTKLLAQGVALIGKNKFIEINDTYQLILSKAPEHDTKKIANYDTDLDKIKKEVVKLKTTKFESIYRNIISEKQYNNAYNENLKLIISYVKNENNISSELDKTWNDTLEQKRKAIIDNIQIVIKYLSTEFNQNYHQNINYQSYLTLTNKQLTMTSLYKMMLAMNNNKKISQIDNLLNESNFKIENLAKKFINDEIDNIIDKLNEFNHSELIKKYEHIKSILVDLSSTEKLKFQDKFNKIQQKMMEFDIKHLLNFWKEVSLKIPKMLPTVLSNIYYVKKQIDKIKDNDVRNNLNKTYNEVKKIGLNNYNIISIIKGNVDSYDEQIKEANIITSLFGPIYLPEIKVLISDIVATELQKVYQLKSKKLEENYEVFRQSFKLEHKTKNTNMLASQDVQDINATGQKLKQEINKFWANININPIGPNYDLKIYDDFDEMENDDKNGTKKVNIIIKFYLNREDKSKNINAFYKTKYLTLTITGYKKSN